MKIKPTSLATSSEFGFGGRHLSYQITDCSYPTYQFFITIVAALLSLKMEVLLKFLQHFKSISLPTPGDTHSTIEIGYSANGSLSEV